MFLEDLWEHDDDRGFTGENLYKMWSSRENNESQTTAVATVAWYDEIKDYNFSNPSVHPEGTMVGHLTQLLWEDTTELGCGWSGGFDGETWFAYFVVCRYRQPGNWRGDANYIENVKCPVSGPWAGKATGCPTPT